MNDTLVLKPSNKFVVESVVTILIISSVIFLVFNNLETNTTKDMMIKYLIIGGCILFQILFFLDILFGRKIIFLNNDLYFYYDWLSQKAGGKKIDIHQIKQMYLEKILLTRGRSVGIRIVSNTDNLFINPSFFNDKEIMKLIQQVIQRNPAITVDEYIKELIRGGNYKKIYNKNTHPSPFIILSAFITFLLIIVGIILIEIFKR